MARAAIAARPWSICSSSTRKGLPPTAAELPDFLPLFLEFLSTLEPAEALELLGQPAHVFAALAERLRKRGSLYEASSALWSMAKAQLDAALLAVLAAEPDPEPDDLEALDAAYEEERSISAPRADDACGKDTLAAKLRQARRPAPDMARLPSAPNSRILPHRTQGAGRHG